MTTTTITKCPICGGQLQATATTWYENTTIELDERNNIIDYELGDYYDSDHDANLYCENDHRYDEIQEALRGGS